MRKKTKTALKVTGVSILAVACISVAVFWIKRDEQRAPRISFERLEHAPVEALVLPLRNHDIVYVKCVFKNAGTLNNSIDNHGISNVVATLLLKRINEMSTEDTADRFVELGVRGLSVDASGDDFEISFQVHKAKAKEVFEFLNMAFVTPTFSDGDLNKAKECIPTVLDPETASAYQLMRAKIFEMMYGTSSAYGLRPTGTAQAIGGVTTEDVKSFISSKLSRKNLRVSLVGDVTSLTARQYLDILLSGIPDGEINQRGKLEPEPSCSNLVKVIKPNMKKITAFLTGIRLDNLSDVEKAALHVIVETLFGSADSDFVEGLEKEKIACNCVSKTISRSSSCAVLLSSYVEKKETEKYRQYLGTKAAEYGRADYLDGPILEKFLDTKKYLLKLSDNGFYNLEDIDEQIKSAYLPYEKVTRETLSDMLRKMFGKKGGVKTVFCEK